MPTDSEFAALSARVAALEKLLSVADGKLTLKLDGASIKLSKYGVKIECNNFVVTAMRDVTLKSTGGDGEFQCSGAVTVRGSKVNLN